jgi:hypothetical protein
MHPVFQYKLMQAKQHDARRSAAQQRLAAQARAARRDHASPVPPRRMRRLVWRLLPA